MCFICYKKILIIKNMEIEYFLEHIMKKNYFKIENDNYIKYYNNHFDIVVQKNKKKNCIVTDKREISPVVYNDIKIALNNIVV